MTSSLSQAASGTVPDPAEAPARIATLTAQVEALNAARQRAVLDAEEASARLRNILATFRAVFQRTLESAETLEDLSLHLMGRFDALARHSTPTLVGGTNDLEDLVRDTLLEVHASDEAWTTIGGPAVELGFRQASLLGLAVHELAINSIKFGALATKDAFLSVQWTLGGGGVDELNLVWVETGVPVLASAPMRHGFGRRFIEEGLPYQVNARTSFALKPGGIRCEIALPAVKAGAARDDAGNPAGSGED